MKHLTPQIIADITGGEYIGGTNSRNSGITGAVRDNRDVKPGNLFVCITGVRADGHSFANSAFDSGAACCLAEKTIPDAKGPYVHVKSTLESIKTIAKYYRNLFDIPIIGITGSVGKTTAKELIAAALGEKLIVLKTLENMNNELGVPLTLLSLSEQHEAAVIEMGIDHFGEMSRLADMVRPDILVMTKIGYSHINTLGGLDGVLQAKSEVFNFMKPGGVAILSGDDKMLREYAPGMRKITFGIEEGNDFRAVNIVAEGTLSVKCDITSGTGQFSIKIPSYGSHLALLAPAAAAVGRLLGLTDEEVSRGLLTYSPASGRANVIDTDSITIIDDCYNANPHSVNEALTSLSGLPGRRVAILGDMYNLGELSHEQHREAGFTAVRCGVECLVCCGDEAMSIYEGYISAGGKEAYHYRNNEELIIALPKIIKKHDVVLIKASHGMRFDEVLPSLRSLDYK